MSCRHMSFTEIAGPETEWVPMGLRETRCSLQRKRPALRRVALANAGIAVDPGVAECPHNLEGTWAACPLYRA